MPFDLVNPFFHTGDQQIGEHAYWRLWVIGGRDKVIPVGRIEMATTVGGANLCTGGSVISSGFTNDVNAFNDTSFSTFASYTGSNLIGIYLGYHFAAPVSVGEVRLGGRDSDPTRCFNSFYLHYSDDGSTWFNAGLLVDPAVWSASELRSYPTTGLVPDTDRASARTWMVDVTTNNGGWTTIAEIEFLSSSGGTDQCTGGSAWCNKQSNGFDRCTQAFDDNNGTGWQAGVGVADGQILYNFLTAPTVTHMSVRATGSTSDAPKDWTVKWTADGMNWNTVATITSQTGWSANERREFSVP